MKYSKRPYECRQSLTNCGPPRRTTLSRLLLSVAIVLVSVSVVSCGGSLEVRTIPTLTKPPIPPAPVPPELESQIPPTLTLTAKEVAYYHEACEAWESGEYVELDLINQYGLSQTDACKWAVFGYTVQGEITWEEILNQMAAYAERMRGDRAALVQLIENMYQVSLETQEAVKRIDGDRRGFVSKFFD